jgi:hypothetical protein
MSIPVIKINRKCVVSAVAGGGGSIELVLSRFGAAYASYTVPAAWCKDYAEIRYVTPDGSLSSTVSVQFRFFEHPVAITSELLSTIDRATSPPYTSEAGPVTTTRAVLRSTQQQREQSEGLDRIDEIIMLLRRVVVVDSTITDPTVHNSHFPIVAVDSKITECLRLLEIIREMVDSSKLTLIFRSLR